jgi:hypothetical protein
MYACGLRRTIALISNENPNFEVASSDLQMVIGVLLCRGKLAVTPVLWCGIFENEVSPLAADVGHGADCAHQRFS